MKYTNKQLEDIAKNALTSWTYTASYRINTAEKILNIKFLDGDQWCYYSKRTGTFEEIMPVDNVPRVTANMMLPFAESVKSKILAMNPQPVVIPLTKDWSDKTMALNYQKMLRGILDDINFDNLKQDIVDVQLNTKGVYVRPYWDKDNNNINFEVSSDIMAYIDPIAKKFSKARYACFFDVKSTSSINETYKKKYTADVLEKVLDGWYLKVYKELQGLGDRRRKGTLVADSNNVDINDATIIVNIFFNDNGVYKKAVVANIFRKPEVLDIEEQEARMIYIPYYRNFYSKEGRTPINNLRGVQRDINEQLTRMKYDFSKREKMLLDESTIQLSQDPSTFDMSGSEIVKFKSLIPGQYPLQWNPAPPKSLDWNVWLRMWGEVGGQGEASRGHTPTSQASGLLTEMLMEADETKIGLAKDNLRTGLRMVFKETIKIIHKHYDGKKAVAVMGRERGWQAMSYEQFKGKDLNFDIQVNIGEQLPTSPIARLNMVLKLAQFGLYADKQNQPKELRKLAQLDTYEFDDINPHTDKQNYELELIIKKDDPPGVAPWDMHEEHVNVLVAFLNTRDFELLPPDRKQLIMAHLGQHVELIQKQVPPAPTQGMVPEPNTVKTPPPQGGAVNMHNN